MTPQFDPRDINAHLRHGASLRSQAILHTFHTLQGRIKTAGHAIASLFH